MSLINHLEQLLGLAKAQPRDPKYQGYAPEITYNPNPNTNIPYSSHSIDEANLGNRYTANPTAKEFLGVDPARFGYPEDKAVRPQLRVQPMGMRGVPVTNVEGYWPQDDMGADGNHQLQAQYQTPNMMFGKTLQPAQPNYNQYPQRSADPLGWMQQGQNQISF